MNETEASKGLEFRLQYIPTLGFHRKLGAGLTASSLLDLSGATCEELKYLCVSFNKGDAPKPDGSPHIPLNVYGVESETDFTPNPDHLIGCRPFPTCTGKNSKLMHKGIE